MVKTIKPVSRIIKIEAEINRNKGEIFVQKKEMLGLDESWMPCVDISERGEDLIVKVELPGVDQSGITILLSSNRIEVKGIKKENLPSSSFKFLRLEREYGTFRRIIFLPSAVEPEKAKATLENGILTIMLSKYRTKKDREVSVKIEKKEDSLEE